MIVLKDKVALVTGGASGLGKATTQRMVKNGCKVAILDLPTSAGERVAMEVGRGVCMFCPCDVTSVGDVEMSISNVMDRWGKLDIAINCAGYAEGKLTYNYVSGNAHPLPRFQRMVDVHLNGTFNVSRLAAKEMAKNHPGPSKERGVIINTASTLAIDGQLGICSYAAAKGGIISMTLPMARDLAPCGIRVVTIAAGFFDTQLTSTLVNAPLVDGYVHGTQGMAFPRRPGQPDEFAFFVETAVRNQMLNACVLRIDAGQRSEQFKPPKSYL